MKHSFLQQVAGKGGRNVLLLLLVYVILAQCIPSWGEWYARTLYPFIGSVLSSCSRLIPWAVGDLFVALCVACLIVLPVYALYGRKGIGWWLRQSAGLMAILYIWFYMAWGLNYSQKDFYGRTGIGQAAFSRQELLDFATCYIARLNESYTGQTETDRATVCEEVVEGYEDISQSLGIHRPFHRQPRVKTMLFTPLSSKVGVTGSMAPFFCEFTLNGELLPSQYPATYAHELAHLLGITSEAEANFYAYRVCTRSRVQAIRFSGYLSVLSHVLSNSRRLLSQEEYRWLTSAIRPEVKELYEYNRAYWQSRYSPLLGKVQAWFYELYLRGNKIADGRQNYSQVVGLLLSAEREDYSSSLSLR